MDDVHISPYSTSKKGNVYWSAEETHAVISTVMYKRDPKSQIREEAFSGYLQTFVLVLCSVLYSQTLEAKKLEWGVGVGWG